MPWQTPTLRQCREMVRDDISTALAGAAVVGNTVLRVMGDAQAGLARLLLKFLEWLSLQIMPDTAETMWLDRHGQIWLVNADGSLGRKNPTLTSGTVSFSGVASVSVPEGTELIAPNNFLYETLETITLADTPVECAVRAITPGTAGNLPPGSLLTLVVPLSGVSNDIFTVDLRGGTDIETDDELRARVLFRIRQPPMGGDADDYVRWALSIPSVTRAWCAPREMGMGTVTLRFMCDALRFDNGGFPLQEDIDVVRGYLDTVRPVAVRDFFVEAAVPEPIDFSLSLQNDSLTLRQQVADSVTAMLTQKAKPAFTLFGELQAGTTIYVSWVTEAINRVTDEYTIQMTDHYMPHNGALAVLGTITYPSP
jgi:uncharacterized phage protein gp47/JayE